MTRLTEAEWKVMTAMWERHPASVRDVLERVEADTGWAYGTVKTIMNRLVEKRVLTMRLRANTNLYEPLISRQEARRAEIRSVAERAFDGAFGPLMLFLLSEETLSEDERRQLRRFLDERGSEGDEQ